MLPLLLLATLAAPALPAGATGEPAPADAARAARPAAEEAAASPAGAGAPGALLAEVDAGWPRRDEPGVLDDIRRALDAAEQAAPQDYEVLWRQARVRVWMADDPTISRKEKSRIGRAGWDYGDRATRAAPDRVEGWLWAAAGMGNYALGIGVFSALRQGIEGKFKERLSRAERIDPGYEHGNIQTAWGRYWYELPWPKYSARRSRQAFEDALRRNPDNVRARVYLADLDLKEDEPEQARAELEKAVAHPPGRYDAPEERRWQDVARSLLAKKGTP